MEFPIEIKEGHDTSSYFWFKPVRVEVKEQIEWEDVEGVGEEISIEEGNIDCFLAYFFYKYFDEELVYNKNRYDDGYYDGFEWNLTDNFYTYAVMEEMLSEITSAAQLLETDYDNAVLNDVKERYSIFYMCPRDSEDYRNRNKAAVRNHISVVTDFYRRFVSRMRKMMAEHPETNLISIMGP